MVPNLDPAGLNLLSVSARYNVIIFLSHHLKTVPVSLIGLILHFDLFPCVSNLPVLLNSGYLLLNSDCSTTIMLLPCGNYEIRYSNTLRYLHNWHLKHIITTSSHSLRNIQLH